MSKSIWRFPVQIVIWPVITIIAYVQAHREAPVGGLTADQTFMLYMGLLVVGFALLLLIKHFGPDDPEPPR